jgi:hypothetical protein
MQTMRKNPVAMLGLAMGAVVLLAVVAMILAEARRNTTYPEGSPQRTVQNYLEKVANDEKVIAYSYVAKESPCTQKDMDAAFGEPIDRTIVQFARIDGDRGVIGIRLEMGYGGGGVFGGRSTQDHTFTLVREGSQWKLTDQIWPMTSCGKK